MKTLPEYSSNNLPMVPEPIRLIEMPTTRGWDTEPERISVPLSHYIWILKRHRWKIFAFIVVSSLATLAISSRLTPVYESTATVDIDRQMPTGVIGQDANRNALNDADQFLATQIKLIQSDSVLRPVARELKLREREGETKVDTPGQEEAPVLLKNLKVTRPTNTYLLQISYRSTDPHIAAAAANGIARSYLEHTYNIRFRSSAGLSAFMEKQLEELRAKMERSTSALAQFERELNVINPEEKTSILSARLLQLNTEYTNSQADRVKKETTFSSVKGGSLEAAQVSSQGEALKKLSEQLDDANRKFSEVKVHFGTNHPEYRKAAAQVQEVERQLQQTKDSVLQRVGIEYNEAVRRESMLGKAVAETKAEFDRLNAKSFEYQAVKREAEADKKLYEELIQKIKEAGINASFQNSAIRIADAGRPSLKPVFPNYQVNLLLAVLLSTILSVGAAIAADMLDNTVRDPEQVSRTLNAQVISTLPAVRSWRARLSAGRRSTAVVRRSESADANTASYKEAIRTFRNSVLLTDFDRRLRTVLLTSASPGEGKTTTASHLAMAHAEQGQKTLLIDGDMRRPSMQKLFQIQNSVGLSNVLLSELPWEDAVIPSGAAEHLDLLPAGPPSRQAGDLVGRGLSEILEQACRKYDLVVLDAPPLLGFAEPLQMATAVDGVIIVTRAGQTSRKAVAAVIQTLQRLRANVLGIVMNDVNKEMTDSYYYDGSYRKYYGAEQRV